MMKKTDIPSITIIGDNNKVKISTASSSVTIAKMIIVSSIIVGALLTVAHCCPDLVAEFVRWIISSVISN